MATLAAALLLAPSMAAPGVGVAAIASESLATDAAVEAARDAAAELCAAIPAQSEGRVKALDTVARMSLLAFNAKQSLPEMSGIAWFMELLADPEAAYERQVFDLRNPEAAAAIGLEERKAHRYSFKEVYSALHQHEEELRAYHQKGDGERTLVENQLLELQSKVFRYYEMSRSLTCLVPSIRIEDAELAATFGVAPGQGVSYWHLQGNETAMTAIAREAEAAGQSGGGNPAALALADELSRRYFDRTAAGVALVPPDAESGDERWRAPWELLDGRTITPAERLVLDGWEQLLGAYLAGDAAAMAPSVEALRGNLERNSGGGVIDLRKIDVEALYNNATLFYKSVAFYILAFILLALSWMFKPGVLQKLAFGSLIVGFLPHLAGVCLRMYIMGRPPVSTLYESIIFVGLIAVFAGIAVEASQRNGLGIFVATTLGAALHFVGFGYAADGDTMGMLVAVLNSNFWLGTHVVTITIGYGAAFVSGMAGHVYLVEQTLHPHQHERLASIYRNMIGLTLVALFFTLFGTILGGIWADQSWGRFWGWDPKENGALLIVLWQLVLLHGRLTRHFEQIGFAVGLVINNVIVLIAWFGVNLLNVGLHSYGNAGNVARNLALACSAELLFAAVMYILAKRSAQRGLHA
jgi:ABC-type transport system involved in cytochrome c biogenesis permease subunit